MTIQLFNFYFGLLKVNCVYKIQLGCPLEHFINSVFIQIQFGIKLSYIFIILFLQLNTFFSASRKSLKMDYKNVDADTNIFLFVLYMYIYRYIFELKSI